MDRRKKSKNKKLKETMLAAWKDGVNYSKVAGSPQRDISIFTTQSPGGVPGTHLINLGKMTKAKLLNVGRLGQYDLVLVEATG